MDSYTAVLFSDTHLSNKLSQARVVDKESGITDRFMDQSKMFDQVYDTAVRVHADAIWHTGDLFDHARPDPVTLKQSIRILKRSPVEFHIVPGNHDAWTVSGERFLPEIFEEIGEGHIHYHGWSDDNVLVEVKPWLTFAPIEYMPLEQFSRAVDRVTYQRQQQEGKPYCVALIHQAVLGCEHGDWTCDIGVDPEPLCAAFDHVLSGHFHQTQTFGDNGMYVGSAMAMDFRDIGVTRGYWVIRWNDDGTREDEFIEHDGPKFHRRTWPKKPNNRVMTAGDYFHWDVAVTHARVVTAGRRADEAVGKLRQQGIHAQWKHKPIHHHLDRVSAAPDGSAKPIEQMVSEYPSDPTVDTTGLDIKALREFGMDALEAARARE